MDIIERLNVAAEADTGFLARARICYSGLHGRVSVDPEVLRDAAHEIERLRAMTSTIVIDPNAASAARVGRKPTLTETEVEHIREMYGRPGPNGRRMSTRQLATLFRVAPGTISAVVNRTGGYAEPRTGGKPAKAAKAKGR